MRLGRLLLIAAALVAATLPADASAARVRAFDALTASIAADGSVVVTGQLPGTSRTWRFVLQRRTPAGRWSTLPSTRTRPTSAGSFSITWHRRSATAPGVIRVTGWLRGRLRVRSAPHSQRRRITGPSG